MSTPPPILTRRARMLYIAFGWGSFALGIIGLLLPLVPTTPFMLVAAWAFSRSSPRFHQWLYHHPRFGPPVRNWHTDRAVPWPVKAAAYVSMLASLTYAAFFANVHWAVPVATGAVVLVAVYFISRCPTKPTVSSSEARPAPPTAHPQS
jgi:hypothetical protein